MFPFHFISIGQLTLTTSLDIDIFENMYSQNGKQDTSKYNGVVLKQPYFEILNYAMMWPEVLQYYTRIGLWGSNKTIICTYTILHIQLYRYIYIHIYLHTQIHVIFSFVIYMFFLVVKENMGSCIEFPFNPLIEQPSVILCQGQQVKRIKRNSHFMDGQRVLGPGNGKPKGYHM